MGICQCAQHTSSRTFWRSQKIPCPAGQITDSPELRRAIAFRLRQAYAETGGVAQNGLILSEDGLPLFTLARSAYLLSPQRLRPRSMPPAHRPGSSSFCQGNEGFRSPRKRGGFTPSLRICRLLRGLKACRACGAGNFPNVQFEMLKFEIRCRASCATNRHLYKFCGKLNLHAVK